MDFPFEYVERVCNFPSFDHHHVSKSALTAAEKNKVETDKGLASEEDEIAGEVVEDYANERDADLIKEIKFFDEQVRKEAKRESSSSDCSSSVSDGWDSLDETSDTDIIDRVFFANEKEKNAMVLRRYKIMRACYCTESECLSNTELTISSMSSSSCNSFRDSRNSKRAKAVQDETKKMTKKHNLSEPSGIIWSDETISSSEDEMNIDDEICYLEKMLEDLEKEEDRKGATKATEDSESDIEDDDNDGDTESLFDEKESPPVTSKMTSVSLLSNVEPSQDSTTVGTDSSTTSFSIDISVSNSIEITSSNPENEENDYADNPEKFQWCSDDLYESTDTDSEFEQLLDYLDNTMKAVNSVFASAAIVGEGTSPIQEMKAKVFHQPIPQFLGNKKYELMEKSGNNKPDVDVMSKQIWLVQQLETGCMCSAKIVSRKSQDHVQLQKNLDKERRLLYELLPELPRPSHIAHLIDVGYDQYHKYLIFEDLGMDLLTLFEQFGPLLSSATIFLITYFTFNALKELHSFDILHLDVRPSAFSVIQQPFNIKITMYSSCITRKPPMKTPEDTRPYSFSPRVFHQKGAEFDAFVDFESWVYTMLFLCTNETLPWFQQPQNMLEGKEQFFDNLANFSFNGCAEAVPLAAGLIGDQSTSYKSFMDKMNLAFSVDVMQYSDKEQPRLWTMIEFESIKKKQFSPDKEHPMELMEKHWNPADEPDPEDASDDGQRGKDDYDKEEMRAKGKGKVEKKKTKEEPLSNPRSSSMSDQSAKSEPPLSPILKTERKNITVDKGKANLPKSPSSKMAQCVFPMASMNGEPFSTLSDVPPSNGIEEKLPIPKVKKKCEENVEIVPSKPCSAPKGKKNRPALLTRQFLFAMENDLKEGSSLSISDSSATSISSWTSSTYFSDEGEVKARFKWSCESEDESVVEFFDDLDTEERDNVRQYEHMVALNVKKYIDVSSSSEVFPLSDVETEENEEIFKIIEKRENDVGWEIYSEADKSISEAVPDDLLDENVIKED